MAVEETRVYAGAADVPAGVRPIVPRARPAGEVDPASVPGLVQAADSGQSGGAAIVIEGQLNGPSGRPAMGQPSQSGGTFFADTVVGDGQEKMIQPRNGAGGPVEPTGLPCTCVMPTRTRGADPSITWCINCGGERDRVARPENALKRSRVRDAMEQSGVTLSIETIAARVLSAIDYSAIANEVVRQLAAAQATKQQ